MTPVRQAKVTIQDVAERAGVSVTTVSHSLNDKGRVDGSTRERVHEAARALGYVPNRAARGLASGRTFTFGLALPSQQGSALTEIDLLGSDWYGQIIVSASRQAFEHQYSLAVLPPFTSSTELRRYSLDGVVVLEAVEKDPRLAVLSRMGIPHVSTDRDPSRPKVLYVRPDVEQCVDLLVDHLIERAARRVLFLAPASSHRFYVDMASRLAARSTRELTLELQHVQPGDRPGFDAWRAGVRASVRTALKRRHRPDAIVGCFEGFAATILATASELGLAVPGDLLVAQDIDSLSARLATPAITAVDQTPAVVAAAAVDLLAKLIKGSPDLVSMTCPVTLTARGSTERA